MDLHLTRTANVVLGTKPAAELSRERGGFAGGQLEMKLMAGPDFQPKLQEALTEAAEDAVSAIVRRGGAARAGERK